MRVPVRGADRHHPGLVVGLQNTGPLHQVHAQQRRQFGIRRRVRLQHLQQGQHLWIGILLLAGRVQGLFDVLRSRIVHGPHGGLAL